MKRIVIFLIWMSFGMLVWGKPFSKEFPNLMSLSPVEKAVAFKQVSPDSDIGKNIVEWESAIEPKIEDTEKLTIQQYLIFSRAEAWAMGYKEDKKQAKK